MEPLRSDEVRGRGAFTEDGVEQEAAPVELDDARGVAVPREGELSRLVGMAGTHERHSAGRSSATTLADRRGEHAARGVLVGAADDLRGLVGAELAVAVVRRTGGPTPHRGGARPHAAKDGELHRSS